MMAREDQKYFKKLQYTKGKLRVWNEQTFKNITFERKLVSCRRLRVRPEVTLENLEEKSWSRNYQMC